MNEMISSSSRSTLRKGLMSDVTFTFVIFLFTKKSEYFYRTFSFVIFFSIIIITVYYSYYGSFFLPVSFSLSAGEGGLIFFFLNRKKVFKHSKIFDTLKSIVIRIELPKNSQVFGVNTNTVKSIGNMYRILKCSMLYKPAYILRVISPSKLQFRIKNKSVNKILLFCMTRKSGEIL